MPRCHKCRSTRCGGSCDSSSSSCSSSSLSRVDVPSLDNYDKLEEARGCGVDMCRAKERYEECDKDRQVRSLIAYNVDTYNLGWHRRLLEVPSRAYPTLDSALAALSSNAGGYTIKLRPGRYTMSASTCARVDDLTIEGDCDPFTGQVYSRRCTTQSGDNNPPPVNPFPLCRLIYDERTGRPAYDITVNGSSIAVYGLDSRGGRDPNRNPCFDGICRRRVVLFGAQGQLVEGLATGRSNTITVNVPVPFSDGDDQLFNEDEFEPYSNRCAGFGFFFPPNVVITGASENLSLYALNSLRFIGVELALPKLFFVAAINGSVALSHCYVSDNIAFGSNTQCDDPNVWTGLCYCLPASRNLLINQAGIGPFAHIVVDACMATWHYGLWLNNINSAECNNGGTLHMLGTEFVNNCLAVSAYQGSTVAIPDCRFCCNFYTLSATYNSIITSNPVNITGIDTTRTYQSPWFIHNTIIFILNMTSLIIIPNFRARGNLLPGVLDGVVHTTLESIHVDLIGQKNSSFVFLPSPMTPVGLGCIDANSLPGSAASGFLASLLRASAWAVATPSFINGIVGTSQNTVSASETIAVLGSRMGQDDVEGTRVPF